MKNLLTLLFLLGLVSLQAQNLIKNPHFEEGTTPNSFNDYSVFVTDWDNGCSTWFGNPNPEKPDLFDQAIPNNGPLCKLDVPSGYWFYNRPAKIGTRYVSMTASTRSGNPPLSEYGESLLGTLTQPLAANCQYRFKMHAIDPERYFPIGNSGVSLGNCDEDSAPMYSQSSNRVLQIVLRKDGNCEDEKIVLTINLQNTNEDWVAYEGTFSLSAADAAEGYDRFEVRKAYASPAVRLVVDAFSLVVDNSNIDLVPNIYGSSTFCAGDPLYFYGTDGPGTANVHMWEIVESNSLGQPVPGATSWNTWVAGSPYGFTFPSSLRLYCNRYYSVKLAAVNDCYSWTEKTKVIKIHCNPRAPRSTITNLCTGDCTTLVPTAVSYINHQYQWYANGTAVNNGGGNSPQLNICPSATTQYTLVVTNNSTGCTSTSTHMVYVSNNDPSWSHTQNTSNTSYYTISAIANNLSTQNIPGFGYAWFVQELDQSLNPICTVSNPSCWWIHPSANTFKGFIGNNCYLNCNYSFPGRFYYNRYYRITRGTWSDDCSWRQQSKIFLTSRSRNDVVETEVYEVEIESLEAEMRGGDQKVADLRIEDQSVDHAAIAFEAYPNPNNGHLLNIAMGNIATAEGTANLTVLSLDGKVIQAQDANFANGILNTKVSFDTQLPAGIYFVRVNVGGEILMQKVVVQ